MSVGDGRSPRSPRWGRSGCCPPICWCCSSGEGYPRCRVSLHIFLLCNVLRQRDDPAGRDFQRDGLALTGNPRDPGPLDARHPLKDLVKSRLQRDLHAQIGPRLERDPVGQPEKHRLGGAQKRRTCQGVCHVVCVIWGHIQHWHGNLRAGEKPVAPDHDVDGSVAKILMLIAFLVRFLHTHVSFRPTGECTMISFSGCHFPKEAILYAVFFYVRYGVSYRDLEEIMAERGVDVDHTTLNRWVIKYAPLIATEAQRRKSGTSTSWRMDETYIKVKGKWMYYYRAIDKFGKTLDFMLSEQRDEAAATAFFKRAIQNNGFPDRVVIDKSGANLAGLNNMNYLLLLNGWFWLIEILQVKYLNNIIEQDHRFIKKLTKQMKGFKSFLSASATLDGIEVAHMIRKKQFGTPGQSAFQQFSALAG